MTEINKINPNFDIDYRNVEFFFFLQKIFFSLLYKLEIERKKSVKNLDNKKNGKHIDKKAKILNDYKRNVKTTSSTISEKKNENYTKIICCKGNKKKSMLISVVSDQIL